MNTSKQFNQTYKSGALVQDLNSLNIKLWNVLFPGTQMVSLWNEWQIDKTKD